MDIYRITPFEFESASQEEIKSWYNLRVEHIREVYPDDPDMPLDYMLARALVLNKAQDALDWTAWKNEGEMRAYCRIHVSKMGFGKDIATFYVIVRNSERRRGIATTMLKHVVEGAEHFSRSKLYAYHIERCPAAGLFLEKIGAQRISMSKWNQLVLADLDNSIVGKWLEFPHNGNQDIRLGLWNRQFPEERISEICGFYQAVHDHQQRLDGVEEDQVVFTPEAIRSGNERALSGGRQRMILYALETESERLLGFTEILWHPSMPSILNQQYTAVLPEYRGRGIGRRLKAEMILRIQESFPEARVIRTGNDEKRTAILKINKELGFKLYFIQHCWEISTEALKKYLQDKG